VLAVDVGRAYVRVALADLLGTIVCRTDQPSRGSRPSALVAQLTRLADELTAKAGIARSDITLTVFGTPGIHDQQTGTLRSAPNLPGWDRPGAVERLAAVAGTSYVVENDVDLAVVGEGTYGLGVGIAHFVYVSIGTGTGMGIMIDGRLYRGFRGAAGEVGYLPVAEGDPLQDEPAARRRGMFESVASADGIVAVAQRMGLSGAQTAKDVFDAARAGEPTAAQAVLREADHIAHALAAVTAILDPELVVLGGGIGTQGGDLLIGPVRDRLTSLVALDPPRIEVSALGADAVLRGALAVGLAAARDLVLNRAAGI
jgi:predicted NBD/HSP70 family sugar kinase